MIHYCRYTPSAFKATYFDGIQPEVIIYREGNFVFSPFLSDSEINDFTYLCKDALSQGFTSIAPDIFGGKSGTEVAIVDPDTDEVLSYSYYID